MINPTPGDETRPVVYWYREEDGWNCDEGEIVRWNETCAMVQFSLGFPIPVNFKHLDWGE